MPSSEPISRLPLGLRNSPARFYISCCHVSFRLFSEAGLAGHCAEQARLLAPGSNLLQQLLRTARPSVTCLLLPLTCAGRAAANHGRSPLFPEGNKGFQFVRTGNCLAARVALLLRYIAAVHGRPRHIFIFRRWLMEQPAGSALPLHPAVAKLFAEHQD